MVLGFRAESNKHAADFNIGKVRRTREVEGYLQVANKLCGSVDFLAIRGFG